MHRLFDLIHVEDERILPAFYFSLFDTLVADNMDQATRIAFGATRYRVVTLKGDVIEIAGTMSGGGKTQFRGRMGERVKTKTSASLDTSLGGGTIDDLDDLKAKAQDLQNEINHLQQQQGEQQRKFKELSKLLPAKQSALNRLKTDLDTLAQQIPGLEAQVDDQRVIMEQTHSDAAKVADLEAKIAQQRTVFDKCKTETDQFTKQIDAVQKEISRITDELITGVRAALTKLDKEMAKMTTQVRKLNVEITNSERNVTKAEENIATMKEDIQAAQNDLLRMADEREQSEKDVEEISKRLKDILKEIAELPNASEIQKEVVALKKQESDMKLARVEIEQKLQKIEKTVRDLKASIPYYRRKLEPLKLHVIPNEEAPPPLKSYTDEELVSYALNDVQYRIEVIEGELKAKTPNLNVIDEYQRKRDVYMERIKVLEDITTKRNEMRKLYEDIKKRRYTEFMQGFNIITYKLKEMYQMITQGGNAELDLVDTMDPFSEGVMFSVRPPRKSWKNISNLSGGEKTLSSLALVFALHYYKPSPLYFMDEIDAALDFKNVSIVANYIKDRTKNAQFIIISLRSNMFELSDYLTGIYKVDDCTDSLSIENKAPMTIASQPLPASQRTTSSQFNPSQAFSQDSSQAFPMRASEGECATVAFEACA